MTKSFSSRITYFFPATILWIQWWASSVARLRLFIDCSVTGLGVTSCDDQPRQSLTKQIERTIRRSIMMHHLISSSPLFTSDGWGWRTHRWKELAENPIRISCGLCARTLATSRLPLAVSLSGTRRNVLLALTFDPERYIYRHHNT